MVGAASLVSLSLMPANAAGTAFMVKVASSPSVVKHGAAVTLSTTVTSQAAALASGTVDTEVYNAQGEKVGQNWLPKTSIAAHKATTFTYKWTPSSAGVYTVKVGIFSKQGGAPLQWINTAAMVKVK
jgi:hypothetical protein